MKINIVQYKKHMLITMISFFFSLSLFIVSQIELESLRVLMTFLFVFFYCVFLISRNYHDLLLNSIISIYFVYFIFSITNRKLIGICAIDYLYVIDVLLLVILLRVLVDKTVFPILTKDPFLIIYSLWVIFGMIHGIIFGNIVNSLYTAWEYYRLIPIYAILAARSKLLITKIDLRWFFLINAVPMPFLVWKFSIGNQDDIAGLFGYGGCTPFGLLAILFLAYFTYDYLKLRISLISFLFVLLAFFAWAAIGENKLQLVLGTLIIILMIFIVRGAKTANVHSRLRKILLAMSIPFVMLIGINVLLRIHPEFSYILDIGIDKFVQSYAFKANVSFTQLGHLEIKSYIYNNVLNGITDKIFGVGIGNGAPGNFVNYVTFNYVIGANRPFHEIVVNDFYRTYGFGLGYHRSGLSMILFETGIVGLVVYILTFLMIAYRSIKMLLFENNYMKVGCIGLTAVIVWFTLFDYYNLVFDVRAQIVLFVTIAIVSHYYREANTCKKLT